MSEAAAVREDGYSAEEAEALSFMADALGRFGAALEQCDAVGLSLYDALAACGVEIPGWAAGLVNSAAHGRKVQPPA